MTLSEIELPANARAMHDLANSLTKDYRLLSAKDGITIDGSSDVRDPLPKARLAFIEFGGVLIPAGGIKQEEKRKDIFEARVPRFVRGLYGHLMKMQAHAINGDLDMNYLVYMGQDRKNPKLIEELQLERFIDGLVYGKDHRGLATCKLFWKVIRQ